MNPSPELYQTASAFGWALIHSLWQGVVVALLLAVCLVMARARRAALRHGLALAALGIFPLFMGVTFYQAWAPNRPAAPAKIAFVASAPILERTTSIIESDQVSGESAGTVTSKTPFRFVATAGVPNSVEKGIPWLSMAWLLGVVLVSLRHGAGWWMIRSMRAEGIEARPWLRSSFSRLIRKFGLEGMRVRLCETSRSCSPMVAGIFRPVILLPVSAITGLTEKETEAVLAHELAHLARRDQWSNLADVVIGTLLFYHPAVWWIRHCIRTEREHAADDLTLKSGADRKVYASALTRLAEWELTSNTALAASGGSLLRRIERILKPRPAAMGSWSSALPMILAVLVVAGIAAPFAGAVEPSTIKVEAGESIQAAIDTAPDGAIIRVAPGEFRERLEISKPITIEGDGQTSIVVDESPQETVQKALAELAPREESATTAEEKHDLALERARKINCPAVLIHDTKSVFLRGLNIQGTSKSGRDGRTRSALILAIASNLSINKCTIAGPYGGGVILVGGSHAEIGGSLIAGVWNVGILVEGKLDDDAAPSVLHLQDSEVRNCYYTGIVIGRGSDDTAVQHCLVSGSAWHGIRYDNASPTVTGSLIFKNARSGIYASGKTRAKVSGNVFWKNEMGGMSCWFDNTDRIVGNTFVDNLREGLAAIGAKPLVERNLFAGNPTAIRNGRAQQRGGQLTEFGAPSVVDNVFWQNKADFQEGDKNLELPQGNRTEDPRFADAAAGDFSLPADSPLRKQGVGATAAPAFALSTPLLDGEKSIIPAGETRSYELWTAPGAAKRSEPDASREESARKAGAAWVADAFQLDDAAKREAAVDQIYAAISSDDPAKVQAGFAAFRQIQSVEFDRARFRPVLRKFLTSPDPDIRMKGAQGLSNCGQSDEDLALVLPLVDDPSPDVRLALPFVIKNLSKDGFQGKAGETILKLLDSPSGKVTEPVWQAMWGTKISPELEKRVVQAAKDAGGGYSVVFYYALTVHQSKREPTVTLLIEMAANQDVINVGQRVLWGIRQGLADDQKPRVAELSLKVLESRSFAGMREEALACLRECGSPANIPQIEKLLAKPGVDGEFRSSLEETIKTLKQQGS